MKTFNLVKRYRKPLVEIDEKIDRLEEAMTTSGLYSRVQQDSGQEFIPPTMGPAPLGDFNSDDFSWPDQGDGSDPDNLFNAPALTVTDTLGRDIARYGYMPGVIYHDGDERRDPDYSNFDGKTPLGIVIDSRALASTRLFYLTSEGLNLVMQIGVYTTPGPYTNLQKAVADWWHNGDKSNLEQKTIYIWGGLQFLVGGYFAASQYYPADRSIDTDPVAERGLYSYKLYVPKTPDNPNFATDPGQRSLPPRVTNIIGRDNLGDPTYYPGPINTLLNLGKGVVNFGRGIVEFVSGFGSGGDTPPPPPEDTPPPPPPEDQPGDDTPPPPPPEDREGGGGPPTETDNDDSPLVPLGYDENGKPTGFTRLNPTQMEQFKDGGGDAAIREGKSLNQVMQQGYENRKNAFTDFTSGISDGMTVLSQVQDTLQLNQALGNIESSSDGPIIKEGEKGSSTNPIQTNLSDSSMNALQNAVNNYDPRVDGDPTKSPEENLKNYLNQFTSTSDNLGLKATHNNIQGIEIRGDDIIIKDRYGFGPTEDIRSSPIPFTKNPITGKSNTVGQVADTAEVIVNALGGDGKGASEQVQTIFDQLGPVGQLAGRVASGGERGLPGKDDPLVHFETVIPGGAKNMGSNFQTTNQPMREETLFEKWKKKDQKKSEYKPSQLQLIYNYFYYLPTVTKKMIMMDLKVEVQIMMLSPEEKTFREKELRNTLINKKHELYMDEKFPENVKQTSRVKKILARNIEMTDPKTFKDPKPALTYGKVFGDDPKNKTVRKSDPNKKSAARFFRKPKPKTKDQVREERLEELRQLENKFSNK